MTHDYKAALDETPNKEVFVPLTVSAWFAKHFETIRSALQLAQEHEQTRKERDELALFIRLNHDVVKVPDHIFLMCVRAKNVSAENG